jgi:hypothetical protein
MVVLGAGASAEAGVPISFEMTQAIVKRMNEAPPGQGWAGALNFVCGALIAHDAQLKGANPYGGLDVERVFAAVALLAQRDELDVTPFVSAWHPAVDDWDDLSHVPSAFDDRFYAAFDPKRHRPRTVGNAGESVGEVIGDLIYHLMGREAGGEVYRRVMSAMISALVELLHTTPGAVGYLGPLVELGRDAPGGVTVATLNYDLCVEQAAAAAGVPVHTGIREWARDGRWRWPDAGIRLLKLHGSIDWARETSFGSGQLSQSIVVPASDPAHVRVPSLVFGHGGKLTAEGPFLSLLGEFERQLAASSELVVAGYSFRDDHVNELLRRWINDDSERLLTVIDPAFPDGWGDEAERPTFPKELRQAFGVAAWRPGVNPAARLRLFPGPASEGLRQVLA